MLCFSKGRSQLNSKKNKVQNEEGETREGRNLESGKLEIVGYCIVLSVDQVTGINTMVTKQHVRGLQYTIYLYTHTAQKTQKLF